MELVLANRRAPQPWLRVSLQAAAPVLVSAAGNPSTLAPRCFPASRPQVYHKRGEGTPLAPYAAQLKDIR